jgi:hypothetical protein
VDLFSLTVFPEAITGLNFGIELLKRPFTVGFVSLYSLNQDPHLGFGLKLFKKAKTMRLASLTVLPS